MAEQNSQNPQGNGQAGAAQVTAESLGISAPAQQQEAPETPEAKPPRSPDEILSTEEVMKLIAGEPLESQETDTEQQQHMADLLGPAQPKPEQPPRQISSEQVQQAVQQQQPFQQPQPQPQQQFQPPQQIPVQQAQDPRFLQLQMENARLQAQLLQMQNAQPQPQPQPQAQAQPKPLPQYEELRSINPALLEQLRSEDTAVQSHALVSILQGTAQIIHHRVREEQGQSLQSMPTQIQSMVQQAIGDFRRGFSIEQDFYGNYPELVSMRELVTSAAMQVMREKGYQQWSPDLRDDVAERMAGFNPSIFQKVQQNRAKRAGQQQGQMPQQMPVQVPVPQLPQGQMVLPQGAAAPAPTAGAQPQLLVKDQYGNLIPYNPAQQYQAVQHSRPSGAGQVDPALMDVWQTLNFV